MKTLRIYLVGRPDPVKAVVKDVHIRGSGLNLSIEIEGSPTEFRYIRPEAVQMITTEKIAPQPPPDTRGTKR